MVEIPLRIGEPAIVDDIDAETALKYRWTWHKQGRGVVCYLHGQTILLHNLISPKSRVGFKDGNKRNCRRENLVDWTLTLPTSKTRKKEKFIYLQSGKRIQIRRNLDFEGVRYYLATSVSIKRQSFEEAMEAARAKAKILGDMTREEFVAASIQAKNRKTTNQIVSEWDMFQGRELSNREYFETGLTFSDYDD